MNQYIQKTGQDVWVLADMFNLIKDAVFLMEIEDDHFRYVYTNDSAKDLLGGSATSVIGLTLQDVLSEERSEALIRQYNKVRVSGKEHEFTETIDVDGLIFAGETSLNPIMTEDGSCQYILAVVRDITDRVQKEQELAEAKKKLEHQQKRIQSLIEQNKDAVFELDLSGNLISANDRMSMLTGFTNQELQGKSISSFFAPDIAASVDALLKKAGSELKNIEIEEGWNRQDGTMLYGHTQFIPILIDQHLVGFYGIAKDVTDERNIREELQKTNVDLKTFWNSAVDPIFFMNTDGEILRANPGFESTFGYGPEEWRFCTPLMLPDELKEETCSVMREVMNGETIEMKETKRKTKSGDVLDVIGSYVRVSNETGPTGMMVFYKDITDLKKTEWELRKSRKKYRIILNHVSDMISILSKECLIQFTSPSTQQVLGYQKEDFTGQPFHSFIHPEDAHQVDEQFRQLLKGNPVDLEVRVRHSNGQYIWMGISATPVVADGQFQQTILVANDITDRKNEQEQLEKMAFYDYLSGLPNRRMFEQKLHEAIEQANESGKKAAVLMIDGQKFKQINDTFGHDAGDVVIQEMAQRITACIRETDTAARLGGDEMGVILTAMDSGKAAEQAAERIIQSLKHPVLYKGSTIPIGAEIGIACYPDHAGEKKQLMKRADEALYKAKETGGYKVYWKCVENSGGNRNG